MQEATKQIIEAIKPMADKIGQGAAHLYEVYARQMFAEGIAGLIIIGLAIIVLIGLLVAFKKLWDSDFNKEDDYVPGIAAIVFGGLFVVAPLCIFVATTLQTDITKIINPEYHAVERILEQVRGTGK